MLAKISFISLSQVIKKSFSLNFKPSHSENVEKLSYILLLCEYLIELAKSRFSPFSFNSGVSSSAINGGGSAAASPVGNLLFNTNPAASFSNATGSSLNRTKSFDQFTVADIAFKRAEQLVIYLKCLQLLKPMLSYAKDELSAAKLKSTQKVRKIMRQLNNMYKFCLFQCKQLHSMENMRNKWNMERINLNADRLLYIHAIELCREAAMEEFFGKPHKVSSPQWPS